MTSPGYRATSIEARQAVYDMALKQGILEEPLVATAGDGVTEAWIDAGRLVETVASKAKRPRRKVSA